MATQMGYMGVRSGDGKKVVSAMKIKEALCGGYNMNNYDKLAVMLEAFQLSLSPAESWAFGGLDTLSLRSTDNNHSVAIDERHEHMNKMIKEPGWPFAKVAQRLQLLGVEQSIIDVFMATWNVPRNLGEESFHRPIQRSKQIMELLHRGDVFYLGQEMLSMAGQPLTEKDLEVTH